jgi:drug/metabolite transporter (DMT)-like permease
LVDQEGRVLVLGLVAALVAAAANAGAALLEAMATRRATRAAGVLTSPMYLGGLLLDIAGWVLTVLALRYMPIVAVQAIVSGQVAITVIASHWVFDTPLRRVDLLAAAANVVGLGLLVGSAKTGDLPHAGIGGTIALLAVLVVLAVVGIGTAVRSRRSVPVAFLAGLSFGGTAVAVRLVDLDGPFGEVVHTVITDPVAWSLLGYAALGLGLYTVALSRGAVGPVVAVLAVTETLAPGLLGLVLLGDSVRSGWAFGFIAGLVLALGGVVVLARSPAQASLAGDDGVARPPLKRA